MRAVCPVRLEVNVLRVLANQDIGLIVYQVTVRNVFKILVKTVMFQEIFAKNASKNSI